MSRTIALLVASGFFLACAAPADPTTPEGAYRLFADGFSGRDYGQVYSRVDSVTRSQFNLYLDSTRAVIDLIDRRYPPKLKQSALKDLTVQFDDASFSPDELLFHKSDTACFMIFCEKMFAHQSQVKTLVQQFGSRIETTVPRTHNEVSIISVAGDTLLFKLEKDGEWRTAEIFGPSFNHLARLSQKNLAVIRLNLEVFAK